MKLVINSWLASTFFEQLSWNSVLHNPVIFSMRHDLCCWTYIITYICYWTQLSGTTIIYQKYDLYFRTQLFLSFSTDHAFWVSLVAKCLYVGDREWQRQCCLPWQISILKLQISSKQHQMDYVILSRGWDVIFNDYAHGLLLMLRYMKFDSDIY